VAVLPHAATTDVTAATATAALPVVIQRRLRPGFMASSYAQTSLKDLQCD
jgi:hypothetical protein